MVRASNPPQPRTPVPSQDERALLTSPCALRCDGSRSRTPTRPSLVRSPPSRRWAPARRGEAGAGAEPEEIYGAFFGDPRGGELLHRACLACPTTQQCCRRARVTGFVDACTVTLCRTRKYKDTIDTPPRAPLDRPVASLANDDPAPVAPLSAPRPRRPRSQRGRCGAENAYLLARSCLAGEAAHVLI